MVVGRGGERGWASIDPCHDAPLPSRPPHSVPWSVTAIPRPTKRRDGVPAVTGFQRGTGWLKANQALLDCQGKVRKRLRERSKAPCSPGWGRSGPRGGLFGSCVTLGRGAHIRLQYAEKRARKASSKYGQKTCPWRGRESPGGGRCCCIFSRSERRITDGDR